MNSPNITVLMSVYNSAPFLRPAIDSILRQTFLDFEFLIIDDGSEDNSLEIIQSYKDPRIKILENEKNRGLIYSLNRGLKEARGSYIARQDSDDISLPERLAKEKAFLDSHPSVGLVGSYFTAITEAGDFLQSFRPPTGNGDIKKKLAFKNTFAHGTVMFRKECIVKAGGYRSELKHCEDYDLWLRISEHYETANVPEYLYQWRLNVGAVSVDNKLTQNHNVLLAQQLHQERLTSGQDTLQKDGIAIQPDIGKAQLRRLTVEALQYQGSSYLLNGRNKKATELYAKAFAADPLNPKTWFLFGVLPIKYILPHKVFIKILRIFAMISPKVNY